MNNKSINIGDKLSFKDESSNDKHGLRGQVQVFIKNKQTNEKSLWCESSNIIPISGYQFVLMKIFNLYLDSSHGKEFEDIGKDTTLIIPDLNNSGVYQLGVNPNEYNMMTDDISANHFVQGFMIGNGGSGEDSITTKNTDYSFTKLRNPIPFRQTQSSLPAAISGKYLGVLRKGTSSMSKSYYIKKFDSRPHIYHSWWREGQRWDYVDPVTANDLGPDAINGVGKTNRIETYVECQLSLDEDDCIAYFNHEGSTQTAMVNELGLVAFDVKYGQRSIAEKLHETHIKPLLKIIFDNSARTINHLKHLIEIVNDIITFYNENDLSQYNQLNITSFFEAIKSLKDDLSKININDSEIDVENCISWNAYSYTLSSDQCISTEAFYNRNGELVHTEDKYLTYLGDEKFSGMDNDEAQRIKLMTYYTFKSIPLQTNQEILINYRIYAN